MNTTSLNILKLDINYIGGTTYENRLLIGDTNSVVDIRFDYYPGYIENVHSIYFEGNVNGIYDAGISTLKSGGVVTDLIFFDPANSGGKTLSQLADNTFPANPQQGDIIYRSATAWERLPAGTTPGHFLQTQGTGANPVWAAGGSGGLWQDMGTYVQLIQQDHVSLRDQNITEVGNITMTGDTSQINVFGGTIASVDLLTMLDSDSSINMNTGTIVDVGGIAMSSGKITGLAAGTASTSDAARMLDLDLYMLLSVYDPTGDGMFDVDVGGTGQNTFAQGDILYASATDTLSKLTKGPATHVLTMNAEGTVPEWAACSGDGLWQLTTDTVWESNHAYALFDIVGPSTPNSFSYECTTAGTSGGSEPSWSTILGGTTTDGGVTWTTHTVDACLKTTRTIYMADESLDNLNGVKSSDSAGVGFYNKDGNRRAAIATTNYALQCVGGNIDIGENVIEGLTGTPETGFTIDEDNEDAGVDTSLWFNRGSTANAARLFWSETYDRFYFLESSSPYWDRAEVEMGDLHVYNIRLDGSSSTIDMMTGAIENGRYINGSQDYNLVINAHSTRNTEIRARNYKLFEFGYFNASYQYHAISYADLIPHQDNYRWLGRSDLRWRDLYAVTVHEGDHCCSEIKCGVCGKAFEVGEKLVYLVTEIGDETRSIPVHIDCTSTEKSTVNYPEVVNSSHDDSIETNCDVDISPMGEPN